MPKPGLASSLWAWAEARAAWSVRCRVHPAAAEALRSYLYLVVCSNLHTLTPRISYFLFHTHLRLITLALFLLYNCTTTTNDHLLLSLYCLLCIVPDAGQSSGNKISGKSAVTRTFGSSSIGPRSHSFPLFPTWTRSPGPWKSAAICYCFIALYLYRHI